MKIDTIIEINNLYKKFGDLQVLNNISFSIPKNSIFGILGPNGSGKSTLMRIFAKLIKPLDFGSMDSQNVDLVFVLIAPHESGANHLKALAKVSRILRNKSTCEKLRSTVDKSALYSILTTDAEIQAA